MNTSQQNDYYSIEEQKSRLLTTITLNDNQDMPNFNTMGMLCKGKWRWS